MNEEIIIDGVNVAGCPFYQYQKPEDYEMKYPESGDCEIGMAGFLFDYDWINNELEKECISNRNCHYKQLKRLQKENSQLVTKCSQLEKENEELKENKEIILKNGRIISKMCSKFRQALEEIRNNCTEMLETINEEGKPNKSIRDTIWCKNIPCCTLYELIENTQIKIDEVLR